LTLVDEAITSYRSALAELPPRDADDFSKVLGVLDARERLARLLSNNGFRDPQLLSSVVELDKSLQSRAPAITLMVGRDRLSSWRKTLQARESAWWWFLDEQADAGHGKENPSWIIIAALFLAISISLTTEIASRFLNGGPDLLGVFSTLLQAILTVLAATTLVSGGRRWLEDVLSYIGVQRKFQHRLAAATAFTVLLLVLTIRLSLPGIAVIYNNQGANDQQGRRDTTSAIRNYERAISLDPDYAEAHYNLGTAYEEVLHYDKALDAYRLAIGKIRPDVGGDTWLDLAYNNLARLHMLTKEDFAGALALLNVVLENGSGGSEITQYTLLKNRGWAYFGLGYFALAQVDLRAASALQPQGSAAHCLLAQVLEKSDAEVDAQAIGREWEDCLKFANEGDVKPEEASWAAQAKERLHNRGTK
jgi:tetratricopeptide (TPR) repeat protein